MTRLTPRLDLDEPVTRTVERKTTMLLGERAILSATATIVRELRDENRKAVAELQTTIAAFEARLDALEREAPAKRLRAVGE
jgi:hypothetical protein